MAACHVRMVCIPPGSNNLTSILYEKSLEPLALPIYHLKHVKHMTSSQVNVEKGAEQALYMTSPSATTESVQEKTNQKEYGFTKAY